eukprot:5221647-Alexandrium_andersonii.AAC.1
MPEPTPPVLPAVSCGFLRFRPLCFLRFPAVSCGFKQPPAVFKQLPETHRHRDRDIWNQSANLPSQGEGRCK